MKSKLELMLPIPVNIFQTPQITTHLRKFGSLRTVFYIPTHENDFYFRICHLLSTFSNFSWPNYMHHYFWSLPFSPLLSGIFSHRLSSFLSFFLPSFLPSFRPSFLPSFLFSFLPCTFSMYIFYPHIQIKKSTNFSLSLFFPKSDTSAKAICLQNMLALYFLFFFPDF